MEERRPNAVGWLAAVLMLLAIPVLYFLSIGPVAAYYDKHQDPVPDVIVAIYAPLEWAAESSDTAEHVLRAYLELWVD